MQNHNNVNNNKRKKNFVRVSSNHEAHKLIIQLSNNDVDAVRRGGTKLSTEHHHRRELYRIDEIQCKYEQKIP